ncbi:uncharacterized protein ARMOST_02340 [Armillaria ostoyae]|uniref:Uncharacterized protein n=1 Tax=Armillaria ostoyae TaxID=47428 RepID=A0A284QRG5_ARMOS|nr:uncharacterized protein ARMOST_02340 [Armillaria ostoyae]
MSFAADSINLARLAPIPDFFASQELCPDDRPLSRGASNFLLPVNLLPLVDVSRVDSRGEVTLPPLYKSNGSDSCPLRRPL